MTTLGVDLLATPFPIPGLGTWFLDPTVLIVLAQTPIPQASGMATLQLPVPSLPGLFGFVFYVQALIYSTAGPTVEAGLTGYGMDQIGL